jgi:hypothetical protein
VRDRRRRRPLFSRLSLVVRDRGFGQEAGRHLVGEVTEVLVDLDLKSPEASGVSVQLLEPLLFDGIDLLTDRCGDIREGRNEGAGLGLPADFHGRLWGAGL